MATTVTLANDIGVIVGSELFQGFFRNDSFFSLFPQRQAPADTNYRWHVLTAGLTGTLKAEGDAFSAAQATTNSRAVLGYHLHDATVSISDDLRAALGPNNSNSYWQSLAAEVVQARKAVQQAIMTRWLGAVAGTDGLGIAVDAGATTYAALVHNAIQGWGSVSTAVGGAMTYAVMDDQMETLRDDPHAAKCNLILMPENQITNYTRLAGPGVRQTFMQVGGNGANNFDLGPTGIQSFSGVPIVGVPEMTNTEIYFLQKEDHIIQYRDNGMSSGGWSAEEVPRGGRTTWVSVAWNGHLCTLQPYKAGKLTGVTA